MSLEKLDAYKTSDGSLFECSEEARRHEAALYLSNALDPIFKKRVDMDTYEGPSAHRSTVIVLSNPTSFRARLNTYFDILEGRIDGAPPEKPPGPVDGVRCYTCVSGGRARGSGRDKITCKNHLHRGDTAIKTPEGWRYTTGCEWVEHCTEYEDARQPG